MNLTFEEAFKRLIGHEGGFTANQMDRGNWTTGKIGSGECKGTKFGISAMTYPNLDIKNLTLEEAKSIYKRDWWDKLNADQLHPALVFQLWDFAINSGIKTAKCTLQEAVNVKADGIIGASTLQAINQMGVHTTILKLLSLRLQHLTSLSAFSTYGRGWSNRIAQQMLYASLDLK